MISGYFTTISGQFRMTSQQKATKYAKETAEQFSRKVGKTEEEFCKLLVQCNIPLAFADKFNQRVKDLFPDSSVASSFRCGSTKTTNKIRTDSETAGKK